MSVVLHHRLLVSGPPAEIRAFQRDVGRSGRRTWPEFSFAHVLRRYPALGELFSEPPRDPVDVAMLRVPDKDASLVHVRYAFETRNVEIDRLLERLSSEHPDLVFILVTMSLDDGGIDSFWIHLGRARGYRLPDKRQDAHWARAGEEYGLAGEDVYEDDRARASAESGMLAEAEGHWYDHLTRALALEDLPQALLDRWASTAEDGGEQADKSGASPTVPVRKADRRPGGPKIEWRSTNIAVAGHGYEFTHRQAGLVAFVEGYPGLLGPADAVTVQLVIEPPPGWTKRRWQGVLRETRQAVTEMFRRDAVGRMHLRHCKRIGNIMVAINA